MNIRLARMEDRDAIKKLIADSARHLSREHYSDKQIEAAIVTVFGVDTDLIEDGTYFVAEDAGVMVGCGGWSKRRRARRDLLTVPFYYILLLHTLPPPLLLPLPLLLLCHHPYI